MKGKFKGHYIIKAGRTSSYLLFPIFKRKELIKMELFFRLVLLIISLALVLFIFEFLIPKIKLKYRLYKEEKIKKLRQEKYKKMMDKLEIK